MRAFLAASMLTGAGCSYVPPPQSTPPPPEAPACNAAPAQGLVGQTYNIALNERATRLTGARQGRVLRPGQAVTMEYRADRLNIHVDAENRIERIACG